MAIRKGFFFSLDAFFAVMIFTLILVAIYGYFVGTQELRQQYFFSEDLFDIFINTKMGELSIYDGFLRDNVPQEFRDIFDESLTIMEQIVTLNNYATQESPEPNQIAQALIRELTTNLFDERYGFTFNVKDLIYGEGEEQASALVARQRFVSGIKEVTIE